MYRSIQELVQQAQQRGCTIGTVVLENEAVLTGRTQQQVLADLRGRWRIMAASARRALRQPQPMTPPLLTGQAARQQAYTRAGDTLCGGRIGRVMAMALSGCEVNAGMGRICAAPTAGSCGILPAVLLEVARSRRAKEPALLDALLAAAGVGAVITRNATVSGAEGGCQAECGAAAAMAGAAAVCLCGGTPDMAAQCVSLALMNCMGLVCDPVAGLVQVPCCWRNASQAVNALLCADLALAGQQAFIPPDEAIAAMYRVGRQLPPELRETARGGVAATPTGKALRRELERQAQQPPAPADMADMTDMAQQDPV